METLHLIRLADSGAGSVHLFLLVVLCVVSDTVLEGLGDPETRAAPQ